MWEKKNFSRKYLVDVVSQACRLPRVIEERVYRPANLPSERETSCRALPFCVEVRFAEE